MTNTSFPAKRGLYDPSFEKDSCGIGFIAHMASLRSHDLLSDAMTILANLSHRGAREAEVETGDGAGVTTAIPDELYRSLFDDEVHPPLSVGKTGTRGRGPG